MRIWHASSRQQDGQGETPQPPVSLLAHPAGKRRQEAFFRHVRVFEKIKAATRSGTPNRLIVAYPVVERRGSGLLRLAERPQSLQGGGNVQAADWPIDVLCGERSTRG